MANKSENRTKSTDWRRTLWASHACVGKNLAIAAVRYEVVRTELGADGQLNIAKTPLPPISRLIAAYESGGVIAVNVPRHAFVDRRKSDGDGRDEGYGASLQQQAGLAAVAALNGYRDRLAKALPEDGPIPEFEAGLAAIARAQG